jgi:hypothetical protein
MLDGEEEHLMASKGKVLFVNRWGTWCATYVAGAYRYPQSRTVNS